MSPLIKGSSRSVIGSNISELRKSGKAEPQAVAIALSTARKGSGSHPGKNLGPHLRPKKGAKKPPTFTPPTPPIPQPAMDDDEDDMA